MYIASVRREEGKEGRKEENARRRHEGRNLKFRAPSPF
jgi:hypothetical protein